MNARRLLWVGWLCSVAACAQVRANLVPNAEFHVDAHGQAPFGAVLVAST